ncbi:MAG: penicillin-binding protein [Gaiellaceae bacterium]|nr:penicillin-binding protein [Gaiellaceae bacterium]
MQDDVDLAALIALRRARRRRTPRRRVALVIVLVAAGVLAATLAGAAFTGRALVFGSCDLNALRPITLGENSFLYASDGSLLGVIPSTRNRQSLQLEKMSPWLPKATVAIEDSRFWQHGALDYQGIARALYEDLSAGKIVQGGSTITQQLVRNLYIGDADRTLTRKVKEACLAEKLAKRWTKPQILAGYLNEVFYGRHAYGAQAGAQTFFSTSARKLTLTQAALLAGLPQAPSVYDPVRHADAALRRRNEVLHAMLTAGSITPRQYAGAVGDSLGVKPGTLYSAQRHPNFFGWAAQQLVERFGARRVEAGGLQVRTTLDLRMQYAARNAVASVLRVKTDPAAAVVAIDPRTGAVKAMVSYLPDGRTLKFNLASQSGRTAGSAFKPFTLATAINQDISVYTGLSGPSSLTITDPKCSTSGVPWTVHNYADESGGYMNLLDATAHSVNTIFAQLVDIVGPDQVAITAHKMGITSQLDSVCSITLGSQAVNPLEMTDAYATLAARGVHRDPQAFDLVRGPRGGQIGKLNAPGAQAIPQNTADLVTYALEGVVSHGTGTAAYFGRPAAGKTGTAENYEDAWFCGYVPQLAACVWIGYPKAEISLFNVEGYGAVFGGSLPALIWNRFMSEAVKSLPAQDFPYPQFTGHTVSSPYSYVPTYSSSSTTTTTGATTTQPPQAQPTTTSTPAPPPPATTTAPPPTTTTGNGQ